MEKQELKVPLSEKIKSIPGFFGIHFTEKPKYKSLLQDGEIELREYEPMLIARTTVEGPYKKAQEEAFKKLAGYIFGENKTGQKMAMTAPVVQQGDVTNQESADASGVHHLTMSFVLPSDVSPKTAPFPNDHSVHLEEIPEQTWAVIKYSGENTPEEVEKKSQELEKWLKERGHKVDLATRRVAQYDSPSTIDFLKKNEVQIRMWSKDFH